MEVFLRFAKGHQKFRALSKDQKVFAKILIKWALFNAALKTYAEWQVKNKLCYIQMGPWIIKETGHKKLERSSVWWSRWLHYVTKTPFVFLFWCNGPSTDFWSGPILTYYLYYMPAGMNGHSLQVGSHVLCWVMYVVARRAEIAVDHKNLGRGAWKLR